MYLMLSLQYWTSQTRLAEKKGRRFLTHVRLRNEFAYKRDDTPIEKPYAWTRRIRPPKVIEIGKYCRNLHRLASLSMGVEGVKLATKSGKALGK